MYRLPESEAEGMINLGDLEFKAEDFSSGKYPGLAIQLEAKMTAERANELLRERLEKATRVVCRFDDGSWACDEHFGFARADHAARLVCIEKVEGALAELRKA